jgi:tetratricopeptide (TPR) repeat protein
MLPVFVSYLRMVFWPAGLSAAYAPDIKKTVDPEVAGSALVLVLVACYAVYLFRKDRRVFFWLSLFPLGLLPVAQIFPLITLMNDRYLYYPMAGMAPFLALGITRFVQGTSLMVRRFTCLAAVAALLALAVAANQRVAVWRNAVTLWSDAVAKVPASSYAHYFLAEAYFKTGRYDESRRILLETTGKFPGMAASHELLGNLFYETGDLNSAEEYYRKALAIRSDLPMANLCLGNIHLARKEYEPARERFLQAEKMKPDSPDIAYSLACAESMLGRSEFALAYLEKAFARGFAGCQAVMVNHELDPLRRSPTYTRIIKEFCGRSSGT